MLVYSPQVSRLMMRSHHRAGGVEANVWARRQTIVTAIAAIVPLGIAAWQFATSSVVGDLQEICDSDVLQESIVELICRNSAQPG